MLGIAWYRTLGIEVYLRVPINVPFAFYLVYFRFRQVEHN
jgi:hypothetical protein